MRLQRIGGLFVLTTPQGDTYRLTSLRAALALAFGKPVRWPRTR